MKKRIPAYPPKDPSVRKTQKVRFKNLDELEAFLPDEELKLMNQMRNLVYDCLPGVREKLSFNVPFFFLSKSVCYIWPSSVWWGNRQTFKGVRFAFSQARNLSNEDGYLEIGDRKLFGQRDFITLKPEDQSRLKSLLFEAGFLDEQEKKNRGGLR
ncbi:MAG TPA: hypothetical protein PKY12_13870 [Catalimonadaceae bacterium]|jgi:hypothetical protein|nr:hypothetical protein [Catalimonadaceae bacterium]